jgi:dihydrosphingosine 1-phosphate phosphatase
LGRSVHVHFRGLSLKILFPLTVPALVIPLTLTMVNQHPQPVDDCPCFEDAIAFVSVVTGSVLARWTAVRSGFGEAFYASTMPGGTWEDLGEVSVWWSVAGCKMIFGIFLPTHFLPVTALTIGCDPGIAIIFTWRLLAKSFLRLLLPPLFRLLAQGFTLPNRRFYTPATEYGSVPAGELRAVPSVVDLPRELDRMVGEGEVQPGLSGGTKARKRNGARNGDEGNGSGGPRWELEKATFANGGGRMKNGETPKHYDADGTPSIRHYSCTLAYSALAVLTKVVVYAGIAVLACEALPITFEVWGWGVRAW